MSASDSFDKANLLIDIFKFDHHLQIVVINCKKMNEL